MQKRLKAQNIAIRKKTEKRHKTYKQRIRWWLRQHWLIFLLSAFNGVSALADTGNPFPTMTISDGDIVKAVGTHMETGMKYSLIGGGIIMLLIGIGVISHRLREDSQNRESGSFLVTLVMAGIAITVGVILLAIGWTAASYNVSA